MLIAYNNNHYQLLRFSQSTMIKWAPAFQRRDSDDTAPQKCPGRDGASPPWPAARSARRPLAQTPPNVLIVGQIAEPKSLDPSVDTAVNDFRILMNIYDGLVRYKDGTLEPEPALAESWDISDDGADLHLPPARRRRSSTTARRSTPRRSSSPSTGCSTRTIRSTTPGPFPLAFFFSSIDTVDRRRRQAPSSSS